MRTQPMVTEYPEYYRSYVSLVPDGDIPEILKRQQADSLAILNTVSDETASKSYAPGKWTLKEVVGHLADTERVMAYRMLALARGETGALSAFDQDLYVFRARFGERQWTNLLADYSAVRSATLSLLSTIDDEAWMRQGKVSNNTVSVRALAYIIAGHELHHRRVIEDKYL